MPIPGDYFVSIGGFGSFITTDPFDPSSGFGAGSEGEYEATIALDAGAVDTYTLDLEAGDAVGVTVGGAASRVSLRDPAGSELVGSSGDLSFIYPASSLLPGGGNATVAQVANFDGRYGIAVTSSGAHAADIRICRPGLSEVPNRHQQTLFELVSVQNDGQRAPHSITIRRPRRICPFRREYDPSDVSENRRRSEARIGSPMLLQSQPPPRNQRVHKHLTRKAGRTSRCRLTSSGGARAS